MPSGSCGEPNGSRVVVDKGLGRWPPWRKRRLHDVSSLLLPPVLLRCVSCVSCFSKESISYFPWTFSQSAGGMEKHVESSNTGPINVLQPRYRQAPPPSSTRIRILCFRIVDTIGCVQLNLSTPNLGLIKGSPSIHQYVSGKQARDLVLIYRCCAIAFPQPLLGICILVFPSLVLFP
jgi:hypothetical protein